MAFLVCRNVGPCFLLVGGFADEFTSEFIGLRGFALVRVCWSRSVMGFGSARWCSAVQGCLSLITTGPGSTGEMACPTWRLCRCREHSLPSALSLELSRVLREASRVLHCSGSAVQRDPDVAAVDMGLAVLKADRGLHA